MFYNKSVIDTPIIHKSDYSRIPPDTVVISSKFKIVRKIISSIEEHHFKVLKLKYTDGRIKSVYLPIPGEVGAELYNEAVPSTHISNNLLFYLLFNRFPMVTPTNREAKSQLADMDWLTSELGGQGRDTAQQTDTRTEEGRTGRRRQRKRG